MAARRHKWGERHYLEHATMMHPGGERKKRGKGVTVAGPLTGFASMRLVELTPEAVQDWISREAEQRPTRARLALSLLHAFLRWCKDERAFESLVSTDNPAGTRKAREALPKAKARSDVLEKQQLPAWFAAVCAMTNTTHAAYLQGLLLTGARAGELRGLRWDEIDWRWRSLTVRDKDESKGGADGSRTIPLSPYVAHLLASLPRRSPFVFAGATGEPLSRPNLAHAKACAVAGIEHLTLHGLRRSYATLSEWLEIPAGVTAQIQGHKASAVQERHYKKRPLDLLRVHHEKLEAWILEQAGVHFDAQATPGKLRAVT